MDCIRMDIRTKMSKPVTVLAAAEGPDDIPAISVCGWPAELFRFVVQGSGRSKEGDPEVKQ